MHDTANMHEIRTRAYGSLREFHLSLLAVLLLMEPRGATPLVWERKKELGTWGRTPVFQYWINGLGAGKVGG